MSKTNFLFYFCLGMFWNFVAVLTWVMLVYRIVCGEEYTLISITICCSIITNHTKSCSSNVFLVESTLAGFKSTLRNKCLLTADRIKKICKVSC